jgi:hypothetical protein
MSVHLECDRCGFQEQTGPVMLLSGTCGPGIPAARPELPDGWTRPRLPNEDGSADERELCPGCKADLFAFMRGVAVPGGTAPAEVCRELTMPGAPGDVDECGCEGGAASVVCPTCGPVALEPHPRLAVQRCSNCKEHLAPLSGSSGAPTDD